MSKSYGVQDFLGSSPLARGLLCVAVSGLAGQGIIPARAGFTWGGEPLALSVGDHPRSRGVYISLGAAR